MLRVAFLSLIILIQYSDKVWAVQEVNCRQLSHKSPSLKAEVFVLPILEKAVLQFHES